MTTKALTRKLQHIKDRSTPNPVSGCWEWNHALTEDGYPRTWWNYRNVRGHRLAWETYNGPIPSGSIIHHTCANRACVNPMHLQCASPLENRVEVAARQVLADEILTLRLENEELRVVNDRLQDRITALLA